MKEQKTRDDYVVLLGVLEGLKAKDEVRFLRQENMFLRERLQELKEVLRNEKEKVSWYQSQSKTNDI